MESLHVCVRRTVAEYILPHATQLKAAWIGLAVVSFTILASQKIKASYGRHHEPSSYVPTVNGKLGWMIMECVSPITMILFYTTYKRPGLLFSRGNFLFVFWLAHYFNRCFYSVVRSPSVKESRVDVVIYSMFFNAANASWIGYDLGDLSTPVFEISPKTVVGVVMLIWGIITNIRVDYQLQDARRKAGGQYVLPDWGLYKYIVSPNYASEMVEWTGFALLQGKESGWVFVLWTICNLAPRARSHLRWYKEKFGAKVGNRTSIVPYVI